VDTSFKQFTEEADRACREIQGIWLALYERLRTVDPALADQLMAVFKNEAIAMQWLTSPSIFFGGATPLQRVVAGHRQEVVDELTRIEYGDFS
jgi:uncharacterized protein (DUF2384 family)